MADILQTSFSYALPFYENDYSISIQISMNFVHKCPIIVNDITPLFQVKPLHQKYDKPLPDPMQYADPGLRCIYRKLSNISRT